MVGLDAKTFVDTMGFKEIGATGMFDGVLPMIFDESGGRIVGGRLDSRPGGGTLAYNGVVNKADIGPMVSKLAFDALRDLRFKSMIIRLDGYLDGEFATRLTIEGVGLGNTSTQRLIRSINKHPVQVQCHHQGAVPRADRHGQELPRPDRRHRRRAAAAARRTCRGSSSRCAAARKQQTDPDPGRGANHRRPPEPPNPDAK